MSFERNPGYRPLRPQDVRSSRGYRAAELLCYVEDDRGTVVATVHRSMDNQLRLQAGGGHYVALADDGGVLNLPCSCAAMVHKVSPQRVLQLIGLATGRRRKAPRLDVVACR